MNASSFEEFIAETGKVTGIGTPDALFSFAHCPHYTSATVDFPLLG